MQRLQNQKWIGKDGKVVNVHRGYGEAALYGFLTEINAAIAKE
jgi:hypothetical protein